MGSLAGAAHLLKCTEDVLSLSHVQQKCTVDHKGKRQIHSLAKHSSEARKRGLTIPQPEQCSVVGDGKVTKGITGLWQPSVHSDVAF